MTSFSRSSAAHVPITPGAGASAPGAGPRLYDGSSTPGAGASSISLAGASGVEPTASVVRNESASVRISWVTAQERIKYSCALMQAPAERRAVAPPEADEDEIEKALY
jgi:hypothetical protein